MLVRKHAWHVNGYHKFDERAHADILNTKKHDERADANAYANKRTSEYTGDSDMEMHMRTDMNKQNVDMNTRALMRMLEYDCVSACASASAYDYTQEDAYAKRA